MGKFNIIFKQLRQEARLTQDELAEKLRLSRSAIGMYESGRREPDLETTELIADFFNVDIDYLLGRTLKTTKLLGNNSLKKDCRFLSIPVLGRVIAGVPVEAMEDIIGYEDISVEEAKGGTFFALQVKGDSMEPRIKEGDVVIVRQQPCVESGEIAVIMVNGSDATVKRVILHEEGGLSLIALNPMYPPKYFTDCEIESLPISIAGKVVELRAKF
ncbi:MAG: LexA family transcriptional regulator [Anaerovoracaceae bacterium]|uniref:LexA family protein n=1 Tax=Chryseobacterium sp. TaxID=1871047 RepID=UPI002FC5F10A